MYICILCFSLRQKDMFLPRTMVVHAANAVSTAAAVVRPLWPHKVAFIAQLPLFTFYNESPRENSQIFHPRHLLIKIL